MLCVKHPSERGVEADPGGLPAPGREILGLGDVNSLLRVAAGGRFALIPQVG